MKQAGHQSTVLNIDTRAPVSKEYIKISGAADLLKELIRHVFNDWFLHVHTNGHNRKSWLIALICGVAAQFGPGATLTLHSGVAPEYLRGGPEWRRTMVRLACVLYERIVCVNQEIAMALMSLGVPALQLEITPAYLALDAAALARAFGRAVLSAGVWIRASCASGIDPAAAVLGSGLPGNGRRRKPCRG